MTGAAKHVPSPLPYFLVFGGLLVLTLTTVLVAWAPLGAWHTTVALSIAVIKASLIVLFFMHGLESTRLTWMVIVAAVLWLAIMLGGTFSDYLTRDFDAKQIRKQTSQCISLGEPGA
jgi:cytochrome c oxidase subunit IV